MSLLIAGGTGFIGQALTNHYLTQQKAVTVVSRDIRKVENIFSNRVATLNWQQLAVLSASELKNFKAIINLTGANIGEGRWTMARKQEILSSRIDTSQLIAALCAKLGEDFPTLLNASAIGIYDLQKSLGQGLPPSFDEDSFIDFESAPNFLAEIGRKWELATQPAKQAGVRVVNMRFAPVLGQGGVLAKLTPSFKLGLGGRLGSGQQPFSWIGINDVIHAIDFLLDNNSIYGPINFVAPQTVTQFEFAKTLAYLLHRPCFMHTPAFILKLIFGQMAEELLLNGQHVVPKRLLHLGFKFQYPNLNSALTFALA